MGIKLISSGLDTFTLPILTFHIFIKEQNSTFKIAVLNKALCLNILKQFLFKSVKLILFKLFFLAIVFVKLLYP